MATKIAPFKLQEADICVKCGKPIPAGTEVTWLRAPERKGYYHRNEEALPTIEALTKVKVPANNMLGYVWARKENPPSDGRVVPQPEPVNLNTLAQALLPALKAALEIEQPRIVVNIYVPKPGDEQKALAALSSELYLLQSTQQR